MEVVFETTRMIDCMDLDSEIVEVLVGRFVKMVKSVMPFLSS